MDTYRFEKNITLVCVKATSFPDGIGDAYQQLHSLLAHARARISYGVSYPENGTIIYRAGVEEQYEGEASALGMETFTIKQGLYNLVTVHDYMKDIPAIGKAFKKLTSDPLIDSNGYCVEMYLNDKDVRCMVKLDDAISNKENLQATLANAFNDVQQIIASLTVQQLNKIPFENSWTAAQVGEHLAKSYNGINYLTENVMETSRPLDTKAGDIRAMFLDNSVKFKSPEFVQPSTLPISKAELLRQLKETTAAILNFVHTHDLTQTCLSFEFPGFGHLTQLEWVHFLLYHTQRHVRQLKAIVQHLDN